MFLRTPKQFTVFLKFHNDPTKSLADIIKFWLNHRREFENGDSPWSNLRFLSHYQFWSAVGASVFQLYSFPSTFSWDSLFHHPSSCTLFSPSPLPVNLNCICHIQVSGKYNYQCKSWNTKWQKVTRLQPYCKHYHFVIYVGSVFVSEIEHFNIWKKTVIRCPTWIKIFKTNFTF